MKSSYLIEGKFIIELSDISSKQNVLSEGDLERLAVSCTKRKAQNNSQLLQRSYNRACQIMRELNYKKRKGSYNLAS